eukprot:SAG31_NODE_2450_length_5668_cov_32.512300_5_plen_477_part_00
MQSQVQTRLEQILAEVIHVHSLTCDLSCLRVNIRTAILLDSIHAATMVAMLAWSPAEYKTWLELHEVPRELLLKLEQCQVSGKMLAEFRDADLEKGPYYLTSAHQRLKLVHAVAALRTETSVTKLHDIADRMNNMLEDDRRMQTDSQQRYGTLVRDALRIHDPDNPLTKREKEVRNEAVAHWKFAATRIGRDLRAKAKAKTSAHSDEKSKSPPPVVDDRRKLQECQDRAEARRQRCAEAMDLSAIKWLKATRRAKIFGDKTKATDEDLRRYENSRHRYVQALVKSALKGAGGYTKNEIRELFDIVDEDGNGVLCTTEVRQLLTKMQGGVEPSEKMWIDVLQSMDKNENGVIELDEFVDWYDRGDMEKLQMDMLKSPGMTPSKNVSKLLTQLRNEDIKIEGQDSQESETSKVESKSELEVSPDPEPSIVMNQIASHEGSTGVGNTLKQNGEGHAFGNPRDLFDSVDRCVLSLYRASC